MAQNGCPFVLHLIFLSLINSMPTDNSHFRLEQIAHPKRLDVIAPAGRIGFIALATDFNSEQDLRRMLPKEVEVFTNRVTNQNPMTLENLRAMAGDIERAAGGILPGLGVDLMIYGCTSGTAAIGYDRIVERIHQQCPGIPVITPATAAAAALQALGAKKISVLTPYIDEINQALGELLRKQGLDVINVCGFGSEDDIEVTMFPLADIVSAAKQACSDEAEALFISCTALRASLVIDTLEMELGIPVVTSNQALVWQALTLLNCTQPVEGFGSLFHVKA